MYFYLLSFCLSLYNILSKPKLLNYKKYQLETLKVDGFQDNAVHNTHISAVCTFLSCCTLFNFGHINQLL